MIRGTAIDPDILQMALRGYEQEVARIEDKIREVRAQLGGRSARPVTAAAQSHRELSPAARKRISMAQKRRWAEHRKRVAQAARKTAGTISPAA